MGSYTPIYAKTILTKSKLPGCDYVVNPYVGCQFACAYCYASFMGRLVNEPLERWGSYLYARMNTCELFEKELARLRKRGLAPSIFLSSVTDCYQGPEKKLRLTRGVLEILSREPYPGSVSILTKSPLVTRDIDLFLKLPEISVGMTITSTGDKVSEHLETHAPFGKQRLAALRKLHDAGVPTYAFVGPLLPHLRFHPEELERIFRGVAESGVKELYVEHLNTKPYIRERLWPMVRGTALERVYNSSALLEHRREVNRIVHELLVKYGLRLISGEVLYHPE